MKYETPKKQSTKQNIQGQEDLVNQLKNLSL